MLIRTFLFGVVGILAIYFIGVPLFKLLKLCFYDLTDPLESAKTRHERAQKEVAAAALDKKTEQVYEEMYKPEEDSVEPEEFSDEDEKKGN